MLEFVPLPLVDDFLIEYNVGQAVFVLFALSLLAAIPLKSRKVLSLNTILFGLLFLTVVAMGAPAHFAYLGLALLVIAPVLYTTASR
ncbi:hypothetical protein SAMN05421858_2315 [Haladaptatus litoreus]|uniref:DUF8006 domain-containing protein n=1 Tax=Haladaptatus litoreus TaxID=553468 RepID=A0A1N7B3T5_9EURY|nr:hypothetical protein [Haladaptatus litoreus]SIR45893.1 hypothetical protein SAMN05421858_2315 [Haladaptatus litoreus]